VSKEEALQYLKLRKIDEKQAAQIYKLVGGRMIHLRSMADENGTLEGMCKHATQKTELVSDRLYSHAPEDVLLRQ
jgi:hypothetical protein